MKTRFGFPGPIVASSKNEITSFAFLIGKNQTSKLANRYLKDSMLIIRFRKHCLAVREQIKKLKTENLGKLRDDALIKRYQEYIGSIKYIFSAVRVIRMLDQGIADMLKKSLQRKGESDEILQSISLPDENSYMIEEEIAILNKIIEMKGKDKDKNAANELFDEHAWVSKGWFDEPPRDLKYYIEALKMPEEDAMRRLDEIRSTKQKSIENKELIRSKIMLSERDKQLVRIIRVCSFLKDHTKGSQMLAAYLIEPILIEISKRTGKTLKEIKTLMLPEARRLLKRGVFDENLVKRRLEGYFVLCSEKGVKEYYGELADTERNIYFKIAQDASRTEFKGRVVSRGYGKGKARIIIRSDSIKDFQEGEILIATNTTPDFVPAMKKAAAIVTEEGGLTCHAAVVSRELGVPCVVGIADATLIFKDGDLVEVDADKGVVRKIR